MGELKAIELRMYNWVDLHGENVEVSAKDILDIYLNSEAWTPIPITKEWLLKLGFKKVASDNKYWHLNNVVIHKDDGYLLSPFMTHSKPEYVHQLQNLYFALTGEELTIKDNG